MNKKILVVFIGAALAPSAFSASADIDIKLAAPNQYDCTVDELELYVTKRTENLRKETSLSTWEDFKEVKKKIHMGTASSSEAASVSSGSGNADAEALAKAASASGTDDEEPECNLFFDDVSTIEMPTMDDFPSWDDATSALGSLKDLANEQMEQLSDTFMEVLNAGFCERMSTEYLTDLGTDIVDDQLKTEYGYTTSDIEGGNFQNQVLNDQLKLESGTSDGKLLNIMDTDLDNNRESYISKMLDNNLDKLEDDYIQ